MRLTRFELVLEEFDQAAPEGIIEKKVATTELSDGDGGSFASLKFLNETSNDPAFFNNFQVAKANENSGFLTYSGSLSAKSEASVQEVAGNILMITKTKK